MSRRLTTFSQIKKRIFQYRNATSAPANYVIIVIVITTLSIMCGTGCEGTEDKQESLEQFFVNPLHPTTHFGGNSEIRRVGNYESIWYFCVDDSGNVYIADPKKRRLDKYNSSGIYIHSIGGEHDPSSRFPDWFQVVTVDKKGNIYAYSANQRQILMFSTTGSFLQSTHLPEHFNHWYPRKMISGNNSELFILGRTGEADRHDQNKEGYQLVSLYVDTGKYNIIHSDYKRILPFFRDIQPDFDIDESGNIHILDSIEYTIYTYSPSGKLIRKFSKAGVKPRILEKDFHVLIRPMKIEKITSVKMDLKRMKGSSQYFPALFGINIDGNRIYLWTSRQDVNKKFRVDVYDRSYKYICTTSHYNFLGTNTAVIKNGILYIPNIGSEDPPQKTIMGRFSYFNIPHRIDAHRIRPFTLNKKADNNPNY